ncbi:hypothetical protein Pint_14687 [Pistacia integerrima]|uniref:Uncharacterized protein n=1 Tax=Pistacia integerrima TaxID=434235 RepID=A0ACC0Y8C7_9ROSI|nr:hypothetical protein Pint_14687 [Pistacia integerrima]
MSHLMFKVVVQNYDETRVSSLMGAGYAAEVTPTRASEGSDVPIYMVVGIELDAYFKMGVLKFHWFSILNSFMIITFVSGIGLLIFFRAIRWDLTRMIPFFVLACALLVHSGVAGLESSFLLNISIARSSDGQLAKENLQP